MSPREDHEVRAELFFQAVRWVWERGGSDAVLGAFGGASLVNKAWEWEMEVFKEFLRQRGRKALEAARRGAA
jgi:hypothetical protein